MRFAALTASLLLSGCGSLLKRSPEPGEGETGEFARHLLRTGGLLVEIDYAEGCRPSDSAVEGLRRILARETRHPVEILIDEEMAEVAPGGRVSRETMDALIAKHRSRMPRESGRAYLHVVIVPWFADRTEGKGSRGFCSPPLIAIAREKIRSYAFLHVTLGKIERLVLVHEVGHALGLVANDAHEYRDHCTNPSCVMYYDLDFRAVFANLIPALFGILPDDFCSECERDLRVIREGAR